VGKGLLVRDKAERNSYFERFINLYNNALSTIESDSYSTPSFNSQNSYGHLNYYLGRLYRETNKFDWAVSHLKTAEESGFRPIGSKVELGWTYIEMKEYAKAEECLCEANKLCCQCQKNKIEIDLTLEEESLEVLQVKALIFRVFSYADRNARLNHSFKLNEYAYKRIQKCPSHLRRSLFSACNLCFGLIHIRKNELAEAIKALTKSVTMTPDDPQAHYYLALAYIENNDPKDRDKARTACQNALRHDLREIYREDIDTLIKKLPG
jgi:tetratricopeptide (TPR) repeat protein